ncbi:uncharacterized protein LOC134248607 [Saccostrea cucullata]|uniref:uncharacterized protein LOC134248607 n=1 Tax=Saccostrea cuccullata TaxID=36930 RepID=UPI002ED67DCF
MEISTIHNEVKQHPIHESKHSNTVTNQKKQAVWKSITEKVNAVGTAHRTMTGIKDKWRNMCRDAKQKFTEHRRESKKTGGGPPPTPLSQTLSDIVNIYNLTNIKTDNARPHTARYTRDWFTQNHVTVMDWPAASPDLNPIENVWQIMKDRVEKIQPDNITDWKVTIMETWMGLDQNYIDSLVESMQRRIAQCIARHGCLTDY